MEYQYFYEIVIRGQCVGDVITVIVDNFPVYIQLKTKLLIYIIQCKELSNNKTPLSG